MEIVKEYLWLVLLVGLALMYGLRKKNSRSKFWPFFDVIAPAVYMLVFAAIDLSRDNIQGIKVDMELAGIILMLCFIVAGIKHLRKKEQ